MIFVMVSISMAFHGLETFNLSARIGDRIIRVILYSSSMGKRKRKNHNPPFPWMVEKQNLFIAPTGNEIVTDAGWEKISFEEARKLFSPETFQELYELFLENTDILESSTINNKVQQ